ncbi:unnamed protein product, partial [Scytosiphon promiscuus]
SERGEKQWRRSGSSGGGGRRSELSAAGPAVSAEVGQQRGERVHAHVPAGRPGREQAARAEGGGARARRPAGTGARQEGGGGGGGGGGGEGGARVRRHRAGDAERGARGEDREG